MRCNNFSFKCKATQKRHLVCCSFWLTIYNPLIVRNLLYYYSGFISFTCQQKEKKLKIIHLPALADWIRSADDAVEGAGDIFENGAFGVVLNSFGAWGGGDAGAGSDNCVD